MCYEASHVEPLNDCFSPPSVSHPSCERVIWSCHEHVQFVAIRRRLKSPFRIPDPQHEALRDLVERVNAIRRLVARRKVEAAPRRVNVMRLFKSTNIGLIHRRALADRPGQRLKKSPRRRAPLFRSSPRGRRAFARLARKG